MTLQAVVLSMGQAKVKRGARIVVSVNGIDGATRCHIPHPGPQYSGAYPSLMLKTVTNVLGGRTCVGLCGAEP